MKPNRNMPTVPIVDVGLEPHRELYVRIGRSETESLPLMAICEFCPIRKVVTAGEYCTFDEAVLDERMAQS